MDNLEKVIVSLGDMRLLADLRVREIVSDDNWSVYSDLCALIDLAKESALALLRDQEPVKPTETEDGDMFCGNCGETVGSEELNCGGISMVKYEYCPHCGRRVLWDDA